MLTLLLPLLLAAPQSVLATAPLPAGTGVSGLAVAPDGSVWVAVNNPAGAMRLDPIFLAQIGFVPLGAPTQEIAFATPPGGAAIGIATYGPELAPKVAVFDAFSSAILATPSLGGCVIGGYEGDMNCTAPHGIAVRPDQRRAYVARGLGIQALDVDPGSPTKFQILTGEGFGVLLPDRLVVTGGALLAASRFVKLNPFFSTAYIAQRPLPGGPSISKDVTLQWQQSLAAVGAYDLAANATGLAYVAGEGLGGRVLGYDPSTGALARVFHGGTSSTHHTGLAISPDGKWLAICDAAASEISFVELSRGVVQAVVTPAASGLLQPYDAVFSPDGQSLYVSYKGSFTVARLSVPAAPPPPTATITLSVGPTSTYGGGSVLLATAGAQAGDLVAIFADSHAVPGVSLGAFGSLHITPLSSVIASGTTGDVSATVSVPAFWGTATFLCQAFTVNLTTGALRSSPPIPVVAN